MSKITISEEKLNQLIYESIQESLEDEGLGRWLGNAYQWARNKWNNFKGDFNAGRNYQRYKNKDYDPYHYYQNGDEFRNLGGRQYGDYRYDLTADRNANAKQYGPSVYKNGGPAPQGGPQPNPDIAPPAPAPQAPTNNNQPTQNPNTRANVQNKAQQMISKNANFLKQKGFTLQNGQWIYAQDGSNSPALNSQYPDIVQAAKSYNMAMKAAKGLYEQKIRKIVAESLKRMYNEGKMDEVGKTKHGQRQLGRLSAKRFAQYDDALQQGDHEKATDYAYRHFQANRKAKEEHGKAQPSRSFERGYKSELRKQRRKRK